MALFGAIAGAAFPVLDQFKSQIAGLYGQHTQYEYDRRAAIQQELFELFNMAVQQQYAKENAYDEYQYQSGLQCQSARQSENLARVNNELSMALADYNATRDLANSKDLNDYNAKRDYNQSIKYIGDAVAAYKSALLKNGYNPLLALQSAMPSYSGSAHSAVTSSSATSSMPSVGTGSVGTGKSAGGSAPGGGNGVGLPNMAFGSTAEGIQAALQFGKVSSEVARNEAEAQKFKAEALSTASKLGPEVKNLEKVPDKTTSETVKNYGSVAASVLGTAGTAYAAKKASDVAKRFVAKPTVDNLLDSYMAINGNPAAKGNSAHLGSRMIQSIIPLAAPLAIGSAIVGPKENREAIKKGLQERNSMARFGWH